MRKSIIMLKNVALKKIFVLENNILIRIWKWTGLQLNKDESSIGAV